LGLKVSSAKTEVQCIGREKRQMKIMLGNTQLVQCEDFVYLGGVISQDLTSEKDVTRTMGLASGIVRNLNKIWMAEDISKSTKVVLYQTLVQSIIL